ncbi:MAG: glycosyltransferase [Candidatus Hodarchaeota archaeon]
MKITVVATFPDPNSIDSLKGGYRRVTELIKLLSYEKKNEVNLYIISNKKYNLALNNLNNINFISSGSNLLRMVKTFFTLLANRKSTNIVIAYNTTYHTFPAMLLKYFGFKVIIDYVDQQGTIVEGGKQGLKKYIEKIMISNTSYFITSSSFLMTKILLHNRNAKVLMYRGTFGSAKYQSKTFNKKEDVVNIVYLGLMAPMSGVDILIKAYDSINNEKTHLFIVGQGHMKESLIALSESLGNKLITFKSLTDGELHPFLLNMDILTIPYVNDQRNQANFPSKIIEYLWCGRAILATNVGEIPKVLTHRENAFLVKSDNLEELKTGLQILINDGKLREQLGKNAREFFVNNFSTRIVSKRMNEFLQIVFED